MQLAIDNKLIAETKSVLEQSDQMLIALIQNGLPISDRPYAEIAKQLGITEQETIRRISNLLDRGLIKRFGVVVRHHELGYQENAMTVWNVPDDQVHDIAHQMKTYSFITLCYRRSRQLPDWPYNLFCMIHGKSRDKVLQNLDEMIEQQSWQDLPREVLFSRRRFKQRAANYIPIEDRG